MSPVTFEFVVTGYIRNDAGVTIADTGDIVFRVFQSDLEITVCVSCLCLADENDAFRRGQEVDRFSQWSKVKKK